MKCSSQKQASSTNSRDVDNTEIQYIKSAIINSNFNGLVHSVGGPNPDNESINRFRPSLCKTGWANANNFIPKLRQEPVGRKPRRLSGSDTHRASTLKQGI